MSEASKDIKQDQEIAQQTVFEDDAVNSISTLAEKLKEKKLQEKRRRFKKIVTFVVLSLVFYLFYWLFKPFVGGPGYGVCKTFIELNVPYPQTILLSEVIPTRNNGLRIWFAYTDSFGSYRLEPFMCVFGKDEKTGGMILTEAKLGKLNIDPIVVERFNNAVPYLITHPPDLTLPAPIPDSLDSIHFETDRYRKKIL